MKKNKLLLAVFAAAAIVVVALAILLWPGKLSSESAEGDGESAESAVAASESAAPSAESAEDTPLPEEAAYTMADLPPALAEYIARVNEVLAATGGGVIDTVHSLYPAAASFGMDGLALPDDPAAEYDPPVEIFFELADGHPLTLTLRVEDANRFAIVAAAFLHAASPGAETLEHARSVANAYAARIQQDSHRSFEEKINTMQGNQPRAYFAYYPDQASVGYDGVQLTLIFAIPGSPDAQVILTDSAPAAEQTEDGVYLSSDNFEHLEVFPAPTPEPDSAAME